MKISKQNQKGKKKVVQNELLVKNMIYNHVSARKKGGKTIQEEEKTIGDSRVRKTNFFFFFFFLHQQKQEHVFIVVR